MARQRRTGRPCKFESLESRNLLAGDVTASIHNGDLVIKGDDLANGITITAGATAGTVVITGVNAGGSATSVNGTANGSVTLSGFTDDLKIKMKGGDDTVSITNLSVPDDVEFEGGAGNDTLHITGGNFHDSLKINLGKGDDTLTVDNTTVTDKVKIKTKQGNDDATITDSTFDELKVKMGKGDDNLDISGTTVHDETRLNGKKGTNVLTQGTGNSLGDLSIKHFNSTSSTTGSIAVDLNAVTATNENNAVTLTGSFTDAGLSDTHTLTADWGDANNSIDSTFAIPATSGLAANQTFTSAADNAVLTITAINSATGQVTFSVQHKYVDDGLAPGNATASDTNTVSVKVTDNGGQSGTDTATVVVNNVAPTVALNAVTALSENNTATLTGSFTDIGVSDTHTMTVNWGDPNTTTNSTFAVGAARSLTTNQTINSSSGDGAVLTITAINTTTGQITFSVQHKYADDGVSPGNTTTSDNSTITVTVADDDTGSGNSTTTVTVNNVAPSVALNAVSAVTENNTATLTGSFTDVGVSDVHTMTVNWGDPNNSTNSTFTVAATKALTVNQQITATSADATVLTITAINATTGQVTFSLQHKYADDGVAPGNNTTSDSSTITVTVADDDGQNGSNTTTVTVNNVAPTVALNAVSPVNENGTATLTGSFTDVGLSDAHTMTVNWGDAINSVNSTFTFPATSALTVNQQITATSADATILTITAINTTTGQVTFSVQHRYAEDGVAPGNNTASDSNTITVTVADDDGQNGSNTTTVTINNVAPAEGLNAVSAINENGTATLTGDYTDIGLFDVHTVTINWGDANSATNSVFTVPATSSLVVNQTINSTSGDGAVLTITAVNTTTGKVTFSVQHKYADDGVAPGNNTANDSSTITLTVADDDTGSSNTTTTVLVNNVAPTVALNTVPAINENGTATLTGNFTDVGLSDVHTLTVNWGDPRSTTNSTFTVPATSGLAVNQTVNSTSGDGAVLTITAINAATGQVSFSVQHKYIDDGSAPNNTASDTSTITVTVADDDTGSGNNTTTVLVNNVAPTVALNDVPDINENDTATLTGSFTDTGLADTHTLTVDWDDPNNGTNSTFAVPATNSLSQNQTVNSSTDGAVLTITAINTTTGQVTFSVQHQYLDDGSSPGNVTQSDISTISVTVADDDTGSGSDTTTVTVTNGVPGGSLQAPSDINENDILTFNGSYTDIGWSDAHTVTIDWGDPNNNVNSQFSIGTSSTLGVNDTFNSPDGAVLTITALSLNLSTVEFSVKHQYLDDGVSPGNSTNSDSVQIDVNVVDDDGDTNGNISVPLLISNVAPTVSLNSVAGVSENGTATLTGSFTDIGQLDAHTLTVNWGDPNNIANSTFTINKTQSLAANDTFSSSTDTAILTITSVVASTGQVSFSVQHKYSDDGFAPEGNATGSDISTIAVTVADDDGQSGSNSRFVTISNAAPSVVLNSVSGVSENGTVTLTGSYTDIGLIDSQALTVTWGDPSGGNLHFLIPGTRNAAGTPTLSVGETFFSQFNSGTLTITSVNALTGEVGFSVQHQYLDDGDVPGNDTDSDIHVIAVTVADDDGQDSGSVSRFVTVSNVAPTVSLDSVPAVSENGVATLSGSFTDVGRLDAHTVTVNWADLNNSANSTFVVRSMQSLPFGFPNLAVGNTFPSSTDSAVLTITAVDAATGQVGFSVQHKYLDDGMALGNTTDSDISTISVTVTDDDGQSGLKTRFITVNNVSPAVSLNTEQGMQPPQTLVLGGSYTDIGLLDAHTLTVNWDDSTVSTFAISAIRTAGGATTLTMGNSFSSSTDDGTLFITLVDSTTGEVRYSISHAYAETGEVTVNVTVADDDAGSDSDSVSLTIESLIV